VVKVGVKEPQDKNNTSLENRDIRDKLKAGEVQVMYLVRSPPINDSGLKWEGGG